MRTRRVVGLAVATAAAGVALVAVGSDDDDMTSPTTTTIAGAEFPFELPPGTVGAFDDRYGPDDGGVSVEVGERVVFRNTDDVPHTFTADDGLFDSGIVEPDGTYDVLLDGPRTVAYHCEIHPAMRGELSIG